MVAARVSNLKESRYRAEKYGEIDSYTEKDFTGLKAITTVLNQMFSNSGSTDNNGRIEFWGTSLYPRGYAMAKWKK